MAASAEIVLVRLDHNASADDRVGADELHQSVLDVHVGHAGLVSLNVACKMKIDKRFETVILKRSGKEI